MKCHSLLLGVLWGLSPCLYAADHIDSPSSSADPTADITDLFSWTTSDASKINVILNVHHNAGVSAKFSDAVQYVVTFNSMPAYGGTATINNAICTFNVAQIAQCWLGGDYVTGNANVTSGITSTSGKLKVFAGVRNDPFFFNLAGFNKVAETVNGAAASLTFDGNGCPALDSATSTALVNQLKQNASGAAGTDTFTGSNVLSIVLQIDKTLVNGGGNIIGISASTRK